MIFGITTVFLVLVTPAYWFITDASDRGPDWTGTSALVMTTLLAADGHRSTSAFHAKKMDPRPEDRKDAEIADGAGELGFFPPYSWWPLWCALTLAVMVFGAGRGRLVDVHHRCGAGLDRAERPDLRVLPG